MGIWSVFMHGITWIMSNWEGKVILHQRPGWVDGIGMVSPSKACRGESLILMARCVV